MIRTFVAISLPEILRERLDEVSGRVKRLSIDARFSRPESIHLTLKFLGNIEEERVPEIAATLEAASRVPPFSLAVEKLGVFPHLGNPRVIWVGIRESEQLSRLQQEVESRLVELGFERENRPFHPHLTVARVKSRRNIAALSRLVRDEGPYIDLGEIEVARFHLYQSILKPEGTRYQILANIELENE